jgi:hypothetical protein
MKVRNIWNRSSKLANPLLDHSRDSQTQVLDLSMGMFQFVRSCIHTLNQLILAPSSSSTQSTQRQSVDSDTGAARVVNVTSNSEADNTTTTTTTVLDTAGLGQVRPNESTSWWNHVGWSSTSTSTETNASTSTRPLNDETVASVQESVANASQELTLATPSAAIGNTNSGSSTIMGSAENGLVNEAEDGKSAEPTEEVKEEVQGGEQSAPISWYSSWGWYSSTNANGSVQLESEGLEVKTISEDQQVDAPLFMSRPEPTSAASSETREGGDTPSASAHPSPPINPITTSMEANWGGWASFFSASSMVKTLGYGGRRRVEDVKRDENGMEVMDLDDDEDERRNVGENALTKESGHGDGGRSSPILIAKSRPTILKSSDSQDSQTSRIDLQVSDSTGNKAEHSISKSPAKSSLSSTPEKENSRSNIPIHVTIPSSSPSSRNENYSQSLPEIPTASKKVNNTRTASPAPSKKSVPSQPPLPSVVLPTWEQIFNTSPRNVVPVTNKPERYLEDQSVGGKLLGKTMRFVSGVFSRDASDGSEKQIKGKEREMNRNRDIDFKKWEEERFREFGKELPKLWEIEEAGLDADTSPTTPMSPIPIFGLGSTKKGDLRSSNKGSEIGVGSSGIDEYGDKSHSLGMKDVLRGCKRVVVIGIHGWFPGAFSIQIFFE